MLATFRERRLAAVLAGSVLLFVLYLAVVVVVGVSAFGQPPENVKTTRDWWIDFALPRGLLGLLASFPFAVAASVFVYRALVRQRNA